MECNNCGGEMEFKKNEDVLIDIDDDDDNDNTNTKIQKALNFNRSHNIMTKQPKAVMSVDECEKLLKSLGYKHHYLRKENQQF